MAQSLKIILGRMPKTEFVQIQLMQIQFILVSCNIIIKVLMLCNIYIIAELVDSTFYFYTGCIKLSFQSTS